MKSKNKNLPFSLPIISSASLPLHNKYLPHGVCINIHPYMLPQKSPHTQCVPIHRPGTFLMNHVLAYLLFSLPSTATHNALFLFVILQSYILNTDQFQKNKSLDGVVGYRVGLIFSVCLLYTNRGLNCFAYDYNTQFVAIRRS